MDIKIGLSIFNTPWLIESQVGMNMFDHWLEVRSVAGAWNYNQVKGNTTELTAYQAYSKLFSASDKIISAPDNTYDLKYNFKGFEGATVAIIPISGPIMKSDYCGALGTITIGKLVAMAGQTKSVKQIIFLCDSPGGSVSGTETLARTILKSNKETIALIDGYCCSAMYWIASACKKLYATGGTSIIGSIGTMISFYDSSEAMKVRGYVLREYYATESKDKNLDFKEAEKGNGKLLISEMLDPLNDHFLQFVQAQMPILTEHKEKTLTGKTYTADKSIDLGFIHGIKSLEEVLSGASSSQPQKLNTINMKGFNLTLLAAAASSFAFATGSSAESTGPEFAISEAQLTGIESAFEANAAKLEQNETVIKSLTAQIKALSATSATAEQLTAEQGKVANLQAKLTAADAATKTAQEALALEQKKPGAGFGATTKDDDPKTQLSAAADAINAKFDAELEKIMG